jgi:CheY-like chemotaxis protein
MQRALDVAIALTARHGIGLQVEHVQPKTVAAIHPTVLRQILIAAIGQLSQHMSSGEIRLGAEREAKHIKITITGQPASIVPVTDAYVMREIVAAQGGSVEVGLANSDRVSFWVKLPAVDRAVLVVDDNADLVHVYRRYVTGTKYYIVHVAQGQRVLETAEALSPDVIVLDVMLPDVDGWELLANLHQHPATRSIPVVVCSVLSEEDLALALGAALYLSKPVHRDEFLRALDEAFTQASTAARTAPAHSAATS